MTSSPKPQKAVFTPPEHRRIVFRPDRGKMYWFEKKSIRVFAPGEARCWIKGEKRPMWRGHIPNEMPNPYRVSTKGWEKMSEEDVYSKVRPARHRRHWATWQWLQSFPESYEAELSNVTDSMFWGALSIFSKVPESRELFHDNPAWTLMSYYGFHWFSRLLELGSFRDTRQSLRRPKRELLDRLGLPCEELGVRLLAKIPTQNLTFNELSNFMSLWHFKSPWVKYMQHMELLEPFRLKLMWECWRLEDDGIVKRLSPAFVMTCPEIVDGDYPMEVLSLFFDTLRMEDNLKRSLSKGLLPSSVSRGLERERCFQTVESLLSWHEVLITHTLTACHKIDLYRNIPPAPLPPHRLGTEAHPIRIRPFEKGKDIFEHALLQRNCMASMIRDAAEGAFHLYAVECDFAPLHSLMLKQVGGGLRLLQLLGPRNRKAHPDVHRAISGWVETARQHGGFDDTLRLRQDEFGGNILQTDEVTDE